MKRCLWLIILILIVMESSIIYSSDNLFTKTDKYNNLRLGNDYIVIIVNQEQNGQGRFAIETTGGAPFRNNDNHKPLVYGRPKPWTSYTSLRIDEKDYVFGGVTGRRAGKSAQYGEVIKPPQIKNGSIHTTTRIDHLLIEQILTIVKSSTTGLFDSVQIKYRIKNTDQQIHKVGLRIMLDTMLGQNDGAPFRLGQDAVTTDKIYFKNELPMFWQAFDSISNPNVTSQGTFKGPGVTPPDKICFADWGSLADGIWDFDFNPGEEFIRKGEYETDSAIAIYWESDILAPGEDRSYITNYGLGGITIVPGLISLGVTSPAEVTFDNPNKSFPIIAYIENTSEITAKNVKIRLNLPDSLTVESKGKNLGNFAPGDIAQLVWQVKINSNKLPKKVNYLVKVEADNTDSNQVKREIKFVGPPNLKTNIKFIDQVMINKGRLEPNPFKIQTEISNIGGSTFYDLSTELLLPVGLMPASKELNKKFLGLLQPGETVKVNWQIKALQIDGQLPLAIDLKGLNGYSKIQRFDNLYLPKLKPLIYLATYYQDELLPDDYFTIEIVAENIQEISALQFIIKYNPDYIKPIYVSRGNIFLKDENLIPWSEPNLSQKGLIKFDEILPDPILRGTLASIHFKVIRSGENGINWSKYNFRDKDNNQVNVEVKGL